jgi:hypothetical protein
MITNSAGGLGERIDPLDSYYATCRVYTRELYAGNNYTQKEEKSALIMLARFSFGGLVPTIGYEKFRKCSAVAHFRSHISDSESGPAWYKYFLCGVKGALEVIPAESVPAGILAAVWGNIPPNSGVSSSSALVSAALLSIVHASQVREAGY